MKSTSDSFTNEPATETLNHDEPPEGRLVYVEHDQPLEKPATKIEEGPLYMSAEEVVADIEQANRDSAEGSQQSELPVDRRDFMRLFGATAVLGTSACIRRPEEKAVPYVNQPMDQAVGVPVFYASTCGECPSACGVVVKTREGRPVKIEGSPEHPISQGGTCALGQASIQGLYHPERRQKPLVKLGQKSFDSDWDEVFAALARRVGDGKKVAIFTGGATGHRHEFFEQWLEHVGSSKKHLYTYEADGLAASITKAHEICFGVAGIPRTDLARTNFVVGVGSDFLDVGTSPVYHSKSFSVSHTFKMGRMGKLVQFESDLTNTGARSDERHVIPPDGEFGITVALVSALLKNKKSKASAAERAHIQAFVAEHKARAEEVLAAAGMEMDVLTKLSDELLGEKSVVLCGNTAAGKDGTALQIAAIMANKLIGAYDATLSFDRGWMTPPVRPGDLQRFFKNIDEIETLIVIDANPAFTIPESFGIGVALKKIPNIVSIQSQNTETDQFANFVLPGRHYLECWGDEQQVGGFWSVRQPVVRPTTDSRQAEDVLLWIAAHLKKPMGFTEYQAYLQSRWKSIYKLIKPEVDFDTFWKAVLRRGFVGKLAKRSVPGLRSVRGKVEASTFSAGLKLMSPYDIRLRDGRGADKPVLQEVGSALTTVAWDSFVSLNPNTAKKMGFRRNDVLTLETSAGKVEAALYPMPGLHENAVVIHRGNGRAEGVNKVTDGYGVNPGPLIAANYDPLSGNPVFSGLSVKLAATGRSYHLASMQKHHDIANRSDIIKKMTLDKAKKRLSTKVDLDGAPDLYPTLDSHPDYRWGMAIDLSACSGCSACMVACSVENNIPQVGRKQIIMGREMHWLRLDRYFAGPVDNPEVTYQPVMCQHCNHAPCEAVCPVFATTHDWEGMNGQTYNRCVGTRYCANACPYKVRRFNWFTHKWNIAGAKEYDRSGRPMNPDVTVRTRGVMEKCTFCVQRIREGKHQAAERKATVRDGEVQTACQQACPSNAITFGNLKDNRHRVTRLRSDGRSFAMLNGDPEHKHYGIKTWPNVSYLAEVTFKESAINKGKGHHGSGDAHGAPSGNNHG